MNRPIESSNIGSVGVVFILSLLARTVAGVPTEDLTNRFSDPETVQEIQVKSKPEDLELLNRGLPRRISVPAVFPWKDQTLHNVRVRYKGNRSSSPGSPYKRGYLIPFSEFQRDQRFLGLRHVAVGNGIQFCSLFSEPLISDILSGIGVKATRCNYARLYFNEKCLGFYVNEERIDKGFVARHFGNDRGPLFGVDGGGEGSDLRDLGDTLELYAQAFEFRSGPEIEADPALLEWIRSIHAPRASEASLRRDLDAEAFVKTTAVMLLAGAFDQHTGWNPHNYNLYRNPTDERWTYIV